LYVVAAALTGTIVCGSTDCVEEAAKKLFKGNKDGGMSRAEAEEKLRRIALKEADSKKDLQDLTSSIKKSN
jgi:hypothetical protein